MKTTDLNDEKTEPPAEPKDDDNQPLNVLLIDDDESLRKILEQCLVNAGFHVVTASEGGEGLQALLGSRFDVVVTDLIMEPMDGITFLSEAIRIWPWMGIVILSGYIQDELRNKAAAIGVHTILEKPVPINDLIESVKTEANRMRNRISGKDSVTLDHIQYQLSILRENTRKAMEATSLRQALNNLSRDLGKSLPSVATAILSRHDSEDIIMIGTLRHPVTNTFLEKLQTLIRKRYQILTGAVIPESVRLEVSQDNVSENGINEVEDSFTFPIISKGEVTGILAFVPPTDYRCSDSDISFLYHATNHLTTVLLAFHRIRELAVHDELTGLYNRHHLQAELPSIWKMALRYGFSTSIMIIDIDHFKVVNDNHGHLTGDQVLKELADIIRDVCRSSDLIARYGGDEFIILLPDVDPASLGHLTNRMLEAVRNHTFCSKETALHCTVSIGAAPSRSHDWTMTSSEILLARADEALYVAKRNGRDRCHIWSEGEPSSTSPCETSETQYATETRATNTRVMVVDDDSAVLKIIAMLLEMEGCSATLFETGTAALKAITKDPRQFDMAMIDLNLNDMSGLDLIEKIQTVDTQLVKIVITGDATLDNAINSLRHGAYDFIQKPIQLNQLRITLSRAREYHQLRIENQEYQHNLEAMVRQKSIELTNALQRSRDSLDFTLRAMTSMLDARENATGAHSQRVQDITCMIASDFNIQDNDLESLRQAALLHDIGKIATPDNILLKEGPLDENEWAIMRQHVTIGYNLLSKSSDLKASADLMICHHEAFDGSGYPNGLKGDQIPLGARIFTVVDAYDAMRSRRPYRNGMTRDDAVLEIKRNSGTQFDPAVVDVFLKRIDEIETIGNWTGKETE